MGGRQRRRIQPEPVQGARIGSPRSTRPRRRAGRGGPHVPPGRWRRAGRFSCRAGCPPGLRRHVRQPRWVDAQDVRAEGAQEAGRHRAGDGTGQVEHPHAGSRPGARGRARGGASPTGVDVTSGWAARARPCGCRSHSSRVRTAATTPPASTTRASTSRALRRRMAAATASTSSEAVQSLQQGPLMPRVVGVRPDPAVSGLEEPRQGGEALARRPPVQLKEAFAANRRGDVAAVDDDRGRRPAPPVRQAGGGQQGGADTGAGDVLHRES